MRPAVNHCEDIRPYIIYPVVRITRSIEELKNEAKLNEANRVQDEATVG